MANFTLPSFPRSPRPTPPRDALAAAVAELKARLDAASVSFPRLSSAAALHLVDSYADALALAASLADGDVVLVGGTSWYYVESHALVPFDPSGADARLAALEAKVPPEASPSNQLADKAYIATALAAIVGGAPEAYDTLKEIADWIADDESGAAKIVADVLVLQAGKQNVIADLGAIRAGAAKGATALQEHQDITGKRDRTDLSVGGGWLLVKPDGTQVWLGRPDPQRDTWTGDEFTLTWSEDGGAFVWGLVGPGLVVDGTSQLPLDADRLEFLGSDSVSVYRLVRGSRLALDTEIPPTPTVDDTVTRASANPVKSSGIWGVIWGALSSLPFGFASLYDWCKSFFVHASAIAPKWDSGGTYRVGDICVESEVPDSSGLLYRCKKAYTATIESDGPSNDTEHWELVDVMTLIAGKQDALSAAQLANIAAVPGKADSADLRYRIAEAEYSASVGTAGGYILADRTENYIVPTGSTASIDIELPAVIGGKAVVDRPARDFFLDIQNDCNSGNLALEFTGLGTDYAFVTEKDDSVGDMMTISGESARGEGDGEMVRLYFNECALSMGGKPVFHVARVTLGDFVTSTTGGNS